MNKYDYVFFNSYHTYFNKKVLNCFVIRCKFTIFMPNIQDYNN